MGGGTLQPHSLETGDKSPPPLKFPSFVWDWFVWFVGDWEGAQKCFILHKHTTGDLKSHHLLVRVTLTALSVPPRPPFLSAELWVICYHLGDLGCDCEQLPNYALPYHIMREKVFCVIFSALTASSGGTCPQVPWVRRWWQIDTFCKYLPVIKFCDNATKSDKIYAQFI